MSSKTSSTSSIRTSAEAPMVAWVVIVCGEKKKESRRKARMTMTATICSLDILSEDGVGQFVDDVPADHHRKTVMTT
jgi:hypothetical protein